jgi:perosamine synthetase
MKIKKYLTLAIEGGKPIRKKFIPYGTHYIDSKDIRAVKKVLKSKFITQGPTVEKFEEEIRRVTGAKYAVAISNGTAALHAACFVAGIQPGDEVITTPITFSASSNSILYCGGTPVFVDIDINTWNINPNLIEAKITPKTKAILVVDFTGQSVDLDPIKKICDDNNLILIQDSAHSFGTKYDSINVGSISDLTTFSFHPVKTITTGEGGAITTNNEEYYKKLLLFRAHGIDKNKNTNEYNGFYDQIYLGYNYRLTDFQAALGISQIKKLNKFIAKRNKIISIYNKEFSKEESLILQKEIEKSETSRHIYIIRLDLKKLNANRNEIYKALNAENIGLQVHYKPVYMHKFYRENGYNNQMCNNAEEIYNSIITIPLFYSMTKSDIKSVVNGVKKVIKYYER